MKSTQIKLKTPISYYGGQQNMLKDIMPLIPSHELYNEPFAGGAALLFAKEPVEINVINDLNGEIVNFYRTASLNFKQLKKEISTTLHSREQMNFAKFVYNNPYRFTNVQGAWSVWAMSKLCFSSDFTGFLSRYAGKAKAKPAGIWPGQRIISRSKLRTFLKNVL